MIQIISLIGAFIVLVPFAAVQFNYLSSHSLAYQTLNFIGGVTLFSIAVIESQYGFILMEGVWSIVSLIGMVKTIAKYKSDAKMATM